MGNSVPDGRTGRDVVFDGVKPRILAGWVLAALAVLPGQAHCRPPENDYERLKLLERLGQDIRLTYVDETDPLRLIYGAADGMVATLDPDSYFLDPEMTLAEFSQAEDGTVGVGIRLMSRGGWLSVAAVKPASPAIRAGILPGDRVVEIDGFGVSRLGMNQVLKMLRGPIGTRLRLRVIRPSSESGNEPWVVKTLKFDREPYTFEHVRSRVLEGDVGIVRISYFSEDTGRKTKDAVNGLRKAGVQRLVLDLRNNPGGILTSAVDVAALFLDKKRVVVSTRGRLKGEELKEYRAGETAPFAGMPLAVLVDEGSASAAELLAAAFQDHHRATLVGARTSGKGSVQQPWELWDGSTAYLTVARYYTPSGRLIQRDPVSGAGGIVPDIVVPVSIEQRSSLYAQWEAIFDGTAQAGQSTESPNNPSDAALDRAVELLRAAGQGKRSR